MNARCGGQSKMESWQSKMGSCQGRLFTKAGGEVAKGGKVFLDAPL